MSQGFCGQGTNKDGDFHLVVELIAREAESLQAMEGGKAVPERGRFGLDWLSKILPGELQRDAFQEGCGREELLHPPGAVRTRDVVHLQVTEGMETIADRWEHLRLVAPKVEEEGERQRDEVGMTVEEAGKRSQLGGHRRWAKTGSRSRCQYEAWKVEERRYVRERGQLGMAAGQHANVVQQETQEDLAVGIHTHGVGVDVGRDDQLLHSRHESGGVKRGAKQEALQLRRHRSRRAIRFKLEMDSTKHDLLGFESTGVARNGVFSQCVPMLFLERLKK